MARVAAIDCGTNSIRLLIADLPYGRQQQLTEIERHMEIVRLGEGVDRTGRLAPEAIERTRVALSRYAERINYLRAERVRMVATSATRDAANADEFRDMVVATLGTSPVVLNGDEEAHLAFAGAVRGLPASIRAPYLVVDIGGGSTEFILGGTGVPDGTRVQKAISVDIGCVRMTERHLPDDPPTAAQVAAAEREVVALVDAALRELCYHDAGTLIGLAGSVTTVTAIALGLDWYQPECVHHARVSRAEVEQVTARLLAMTRAQRLALPVMHPGRADVIGAGALIMRVIMKQVGADEMVASEHDILDGIAYAA